MKSHDLSELFVYKGKNWSGNDEPIHSFCFRCGVVVHSNFIDSNGIMNPDKENIWPCNIQQLDGTHNLWMQDYLNHNTLSRFNGIHPSRSGYVVKGLF